MPITITKELPIAKKHEKGEFKCPLCGHLMKILKYHYGGGGEWKDECSYFAAKCTYSGCGLEGPGHYGDKDAAYKDLRSMSK